MRIAVIVPFLNEESHLPAFLGSIAAQARPPDCLTLVDDGSEDGSAGLAEDFAREHAWALVSSRPPRPRERDRLGGAGELKAFLWARERLEGDYDVVAKMDADLCLTPGVFEQVERAFLEDERLGITGPYLSIRAPDGSLERERCPAYHVRGPAKFYRRTCLEQISPLPPILGWDTIDEVAARRYGWRTASFAMPGGDPVHMRPTGSFDGRLRGYRRWGECAYAIGDHPLWLMLGVARRATERPWLLGGLSYLAGWASAMARRVPRASPELRAHVRREQVERVRRLRRRGEGTDAGGVSALRRARGES